MQKELTRLNVAYHVSRHITAPSVQLLLDTLESVLEPVGSSTGSVKTEKAGSTTTGAHSSTDVGDNDGDAIIEEFLCRVSEAGVSRQLGSARVLRAGDGLQAGGPRLRLEREPGGAGAGGSFVPHLSAVGRLQAKGFLHRLGWVQGGAGAARSLSPQLRVGGGFQAKASLPRLDWAPGEAGAGGSLVTPVNVDDDLAGQYYLHDEYDDQRGRGRYERY